MINAVIQYEKLEALRHLFHSSDLQFIDMKKGLTNTNYLLKTKEDAYVLRVPRSDSANIVHRHHETLALEAIKDSHIDVEMLYYDESSGYNLLVM